MIDQLRGDKGQKIGHASVDKIGEFKLSASAQNYEIWLNYLTGWTPGLIKAIDETITINGGLTDNEMESLHERFFSSTQLSNQVMETGSRIAKEITDALEALKAAGDTTEQYGATLQNAARTLETAELSSDALQRIITVLASSTHDMSKQNTELNEKLRQSSDEIESLRSSLRAARAEALTDGLTGVANRKYFDETLRRRTEEAEATDEKLCLVLCDIDHFKKFNDTWGHQTGDQVIRFVASSLSQASMPDFLVARYGGEEFAIIMPRTTIEQAADISERIRKAIQTKKLMRRSTGQPLGQITVSFGIARYSADDNIQSLIERADTCLYRSKQTGRNRVTVEDQLDDFKASA